MLRPVRLRIAAILLLTAPAMATTLWAQAPGEVTGLDLTNPSTLTWDPTAGANDYNVYRGSLAWLASGAGAQCHADEVTATSFSTPAGPALDEGYFYLVTAESNTGGEGSAGTTSGGSAREVRGACNSVMRNHVLDRLGYGWNEWSRDRYGALGTQGYMDEQLNPSSIDESTNLELTTRTANLIPPDTLQELQALDIVQAVYGRRQIEQQMTFFWDNHFNTDYVESFQYFGFYQALYPQKQTYESTKFHYDALNAFRSLAFNGTFREIVEQSALSPSMILYLNTNTNVKASPNENFARELLELHTMGVDGGYTQQDVVELAKVFTGWNVCKKTVANAGDPLAACIPGPYGTATEPAGVFVHNFRPGQHDTGQKTLFAGTPHQVIIPARPNNDPNGVDDVRIALDAIVAHPSTPRYIVTKLIQRLVTEYPTQPMIDAVVAEWNDASNPQGVGDLREVLRAVVSLPAFRDPDFVRDKIKTPLEHIVSGFRAIRGRTDGLNLNRSYLTRMQERLHQNPVPTGYSELGADWLDTNNLLERQNFGLDVATDPNSMTLGSDVIGLLNANGVSTAPTPNNAPGIVGFFNDVLFGGGLTSAERQIAVDYLNTDSSGVPSNYTDSRIRETVGFMMGFAQFLEQ